MSRIFACHLSPVYGSLQQLAERCPSGHQEAVPDDLRYVLVRGGLGRNSA